MRGYPADPQSAIQSWGQDMAEAAGPHAGSLGEGPWWRQLNRYHWIVLAIASMTWLFDCMDQQFFVITRQPALRSLLYGRDVNVAGAPALTPEQNAKVQFYSRVALAMVMLGWAVGGFFFGLMGDRMGRVKTMMVTISIYAGFTGISAFALSWWDYVAYRFLMGLGIGGLFGAAVSLVAEVMPAGARPHALGLLQALSALGNLIGAAVAMVLNAQGVSFGIENWRWIFVLGILPALLVIAVQRSLKEPESWQQARSKASEDLHRQMGAWRDLFSSRLRRNTVVGLTLAVAGVIGLWGAAYFTPELIRDAAGDRQVGGALMLQHIGAFFGVYVFTMIAARFGRKPAFAICFLSAFAATAFVFQFLRHTGQIYWMLPMIGFWSLSVFGGYAIYFPELYPTRLRSSGVGFCYNVGRVISALAIFGTAYLERGLQKSGIAEPFRVGSILIACIYFLGVVILIWAPETKGRPLPED
jgi:MFS family permease